MQLLPVHTLRLGVELDSFDGHHYISSVAPGGPVDKHGVLRPEDELLEVNRQTADDDDDESLKVCQMKPNLEADRVSLQYRAV